MRGYAFDELEEITLENLLIDWLNEIGCIVVRDGNALSVFFGLDIIIDDTEVALRCRNTDILSSSIYDPDKFGEFKERIEKCVKIRHRECSGCQYRKSRIIT